MLGCGKLLRFKTLRRKKLLKAGGRARSFGGGRRPRLQHLKVIRLSNNKRKERALWLPHRKQARSEQVSTNYLEIWEREARPRCINAVTEDDPCAASLRVEGRRPGSSDRGDYGRTNSDRRSATPPRPYTGRASAWRPVFRSAPRVSLCLSSSSSEVSLLLNWSARNAGDGREYTQTTLRCQALFSETVIFIFKAPPDAMRRAACVSFHAEGCAGRARRAILAPRVGSLKDGSRASCK